MLISYNPVYCAIFLIGSFVNIACSFFLLEVEFLALLFLIVYVGAIAILFIFVVMTLNIKDMYLDWTDRNIFELFITILFGFFVLVSNKNYLVYLSFEEFALNNILTYDLDYNFLAYLVKYKVNDIFIFNNLLYTYYANYLYLIGYLLIIAIVGALVITQPINKLKRTRRQTNIKDRSYASVVSLKKV